jgi:hypothetical protein
LPYDRFTSLPRAQDIGGESPYIGLKDVFKASDCGRLGRQAAGHPLERAPRGESCRKDRPTASVLLEAKAAALHPNGTRVHYLNYLQGGRARRGKEAHAIRLAS